MSEYIERGALLRSKWWESLKSDFDRARAKCIIATFPAADVAPVVRCQECVHFRDYTDRHGVMHLYCIRENHIPKVKPEHFCSYGERKDDHD